MVWLVVSLCLSVALHAGDKQSEWETDHAAILQALEQRLPKVRSYLKSPPNDDADILYAALLDPGIPGDIKCRIARYFQFLTAFHKAELETPSPVLVEITRLRKALDDNAARGHGDLASAIQTLKQFQESEERRGFRVLARSISGAAKVLDQEDAKTYTADGDSRVLVQSVVGAVLGGFNSGKILSVVSGVDVAIPTFTAGASVGAISKSVTALFNPDEQRDHKPANPEPIK